MDYKHPDSKFFEKNNLPPPSVSAHGTEEDVRANLKPLKTRNWRQEGNWIIADTDAGQLSQQIPTHSICIGTDGQGMPIFKRIDSK